MGKLVCLHFSPTGNTRRVAEAVCEGLSEATGITCESIDCTPFGSRDRTLSFDRDDMLVLAMPTYRGKLPATVSDEMAMMIEGDGTRAVAVVTFGNRCFDNSLAQMVSILDGRGFSIIAAGAFSCSHTYSAKIATGRPDDSDLGEARLFGMRAASLPIGKPSDLGVPGSADAPFFQPVDLDDNPVSFHHCVPRRDVGECTECGRCRELCPLGSIDMGLETNRKCIKCHACIIGCPGSARRFTDPGMLAHIGQLERDLTERRANSTYPSMDRTAT